VPRSVRKKEKLLQRRLAETEERIASGEGQIAQQRKFIAMLEANGRPATHAKYLLTGIELLQAARLENRTRLLEQLKGVKYTFRRIVRRTLEQSRTGDRPVGALS
jgi:hypothetical protein